MILNHRHFDIVTWYCFSRSYLGKLNHNVAFNVFFIVLYKSSTSTNTNNISSWLLNSVPLSENSNTPSSISIKQPSFLIRMNQYPTNRSVRNAIYSQVKTVSTASEADTHQWLCCGSYLSFFLSLLPYSTEDLALQLTQKLTLRNSLPHIKFERCSNLHVLFTWHHGGRQDSYIRKLYRPARRISQVLLQDSAYIMRLMVDGVSLEEDMSNKTADESLHNNSQIRSHNNL